MKKYFIPFLLFSGIATLYAYNKHLEREIESEKKGEEYKGQFNPNMIQKTTEVRRKKFIPVDNTDIHSKRNNLVTHDISVDKGGLIGKADGSFQNKPLHICLYGDCFDFSTLTVNKLKDYGWLIDGETVSARYKDGIHVWMKRESFPKILDVDYVDDLICSFSIRCCEKTDLKENFTVRESIRFGSTEEDVRKEFGPPADITDMSKYGYKILLYRNNSYVMVLNISNETGLNYFSVDREKNAEA